jgi:hypothetical protein
MSFEFAYLLGHISAAVGEEEEKGSIFSNNH